MATIDLKKIIATSLRTEFWENFQDALSTELELMRSTIAEKEDFFNVRNQTDITRLTEISKTFGFAVDRSIDETTTYIKNNLRVTSNRVRHKTSYTGYSYIFSLAGYFGKIYTFFTLNYLLRRGIDETTILSNLDAILDYSLPFLGFDAELFFKSDQVTGVTLDEDPVWYLDGTVHPTLDEDLNKSPTTHLAIEYTPDKLITENSIEYYINNTYLKYLLSASLYNKKLTEVPHVGVQVNFLTDTTGYYDNLSNSTYSTPILKLNCATTQKNYYSLTDAVALDVSTGMGTYEMDLDLEIPWTLDQAENDEFASEDINTLFYTLEFGNGKKGIVSKDYPEINQSLFAYFPFDETSGSTFNDKANNNYSGTLAGGYTRQSGIIGYDVLYNGSTGYGLVNSINITPDLETISFWVKGLKDSQKVSGDITLLHIYNAADDYLQVQYNTISENLTVSMTGNNLTFNTDLLDDSEHLISITYDNVNTRYRLYVDGSLASTQTFGSSLPASTSYDYYIGVDQGLTEFFTGQIDELRCYSKVLTSDDLTFLYTSKLGDIENLGNLLYTNTQITHRFENSNWYVISGRLDFKSEIQAIIDDDVAYPTTQEKKAAIDLLYEETVEITEIGIRNQAGDMKIYGTFPTIQMKKDKHISIQYLIKK